METVNIPAAKTKKQIRRIIKASGISEEEVLSGLKEERRKLYKETYEKKKAKRPLKLRGKHSP